jgi:defect-in-organelle-trafficking protein DotB
MDHYKANKPFYIGQDIDVILKGVEANGGFNDLDIATDKPITIFKHGRLFHITDRPLKNEEVREIVNHIAKDASAYSAVTSGDEIDKAYVILDELADEVVIRRYRMNMVPVRNKFGTEAVHITCRSIRSDPPRLDTLDIEPELLPHLVARQGLGMVVGETGSGKSTLIASIIGNEVSKPGNYKKVLTAESPVEYIYDNVQHPDNLVFQQEVSEFGGDVKTFSGAVRNNLRRNPNIIVIGESRDLETIQAMLRAASTGHMTYTTLHANSVGEAIRRTLNEFSVTEKQARLYEMMSIMRFVVVQYLAETIDGGRVALREFLVFTPEIRKALQDCNADDVVTTIHKFVESHGQSLKKAATIQFDKKVISEQEYKYVVSGI